MAISWGTIQSLILFFGPMVSHKLLTYYRTARDAPRIHGLLPRPLPLRILSGLLLLVFTSLLLLAKSLPAFAPENIFTLTQSRLQIPVDTLFTRLSALRSDHQLTPRDAVLRTRLPSQNAKLLYLQYGPDVMAECPFCSSDEPNSFYYYALPALLTPHLANLFVIATVTSPLLTGREGASWRRPATIAAVLGAFADVYFVGAYNAKGNAVRTRLGDIDAFFWRARTNRFVGLAILDAILALVLYLTGTQRAFVAPPSAAERIDFLMRLGVTGAVKNKMNALEVLKNTTFRDEGLRAQAIAYWAHEGKVTREVMEEREVVERLNDALENRVHLKTIERDAEMYAMTVLPILEGEKVGADVKKVD